MKEVSIGIFSDIHGNLNALRQILKYFRSKNVDAVFHLGDVICMGPRPAECMDMLLCATNLTCILGNHDKDYLNDNTTPPLLSHVSREHKEFTFNLLGERYKDAVSRFPALVVQDYNGLSVAFLHYAFARPSDKQRDKRAVFRPIEFNPSTEELDEMFADIPADMIFFGHQHSPCEGVGRKIYCNVGSAGCFKQSMTRGAILHVDREGNPTVEKFAVPYDREATLAEMDALEVPSADFIKDFYFSVD